MKCRGPQPSGGSIIQLADAVGGDEAVQTVDAHLDLCAGSFVVSALLPSHASLLSLIYFVMGTVQASRACQGHGGSDRTPRTCTLSSLLTKKVKVASGLLEVTLVLIAPLSRRIGP